MPTAAELQESMLNPARDYDREIADLEARVREVEAENAKFGELMVRVEHNGDGDNQELPATPESFKAFVVELQSEWDAAEKRAAKAESDLTAARVAIGELVGGLKPFAKYANAVSDSWPDDSGPCLLFKQADGSLAHNPGIGLGNCRHAAALVARYGQ